MYLQLYSLWVQVVESEVSSFHSCQWYGLRLCVLGKGNLSSIFKRVSDAEDDGLFAL